MHACVTLIKAEAEKAVYEAVCRISWSAAHVKALLKAEAAQEYSLGGLNTK